MEGGEGGRGRRQTLRLTKSSQLARRGGGHANRAASGVFAGLDGGLTATCAATACTFESSRPAVGTGD
eukprot:361502-Chlamydomonas_euryale.AAC.3